MQTLPQNYPCPALTVDTVIFTLREAQLQVLLIQREEAPYGGMWALPGGFVRLSESLEAAALRVLNEETGLKKAYLEQLSAFGDPARDPRGRVVTIAYFALISMDTPTSSESYSLTRQACWFPLEKLPPLAFDHALIVGYALQRLRDKLKYSVIGFELLPAEFTLSELQATYEMILGEKLDKRNFRRRILETELLEITPHMRMGEGRPAHLYRCHTRP